MRPCPGLRHNAAMAAATPTRPAPPPIDDACALFLDVDGTLLDFAPHPDAVSVPASLRDILQALHRRLGGAVALVSGRPLGVLDALFHPLALPAAGMHGLERRNGRFHSPAPAPPEALETVIEEARAFAIALPGVVVEDKGSGLGLHWRSAPQHGGALRGFAESALDRLPGYRLQHGDHVAELRPDGADKGDAIAALMQQAPFAGRRPVFVGDDLTDEHGFAVVNSHGGASVLVGTREPSEATHGLHDVAAVHAWLARGAAAAGTTTPETITRGTGE